MFCHPMLVIRHLLKVMSHCKPLPGDVATLSKAKQKLRRRPKPLWWYLSVPINSGSCNLQNLTESDRIWPNLTQHWPNLTRWRETLTTQNTRVMTQPQKSCFIYISSMQCIVYSGKSASAITVNSVLVPLRQYTYNINIQYYTHIHQ